MLTFEKTSFEDIFCKNTATSHTRNKDLSLGENI